MSEIICPDCGERNAGPVEFCAACGAFLAWDAGDAGPGDSEPAGVGRHAAGQSAGSALSGQAQESRVDGQPPLPSAEPPQHQHQGPSAARTLAAGAPTMPVPQHHLPQPAREWGAAQLGGSAFEPPIRTDRPGPALAAEPVPLWSAPPQPAAPAENMCPQCGAVIDAGARFCRKCGLALKAPLLRDDAPSRPQPAPERRPWWRRWFRPGDNTRRAARSAFRRSLPLRYRLVRWLMALLGIGAIVGALTLIGQNPVRWVTDRVNDLRGSLVQVEGLQAYDAPQDGTAPAAPSGTASPSAGASAAPSDTAENVLDNLSDTAWSTAWSTQFQTTNPADAPCVDPSSPATAGAPGSMLIVPDQTITVREISVAAGRSKDDPRRLFEWRPKIIQLAFSDGSCQQITLTDSDALQPIKINPVETSQIRLSVVDAFEPATDKPIPLVAITDIRLLQRP